MIDRIKVSIGACTAGHYCPSPGEEIPCPEGFFNPNTNSTSVADCLACTPGSFCGTSGLTTPTGVCSPGWFCSGYDVTPTPIGKKCWKGHYCPQGSTSPLPCPLGNYQSNEGQSSCSNCPAGKFCWEPGLIEPWDCDDGYFCGVNSTTPTETICAARRFCKAGIGKYCPAGYRNGFEGMRECHECGVTVYCEDIGRALFTGKCADGYYCEHNETQPDPPNNVCPPGHYCKNGQLFQCSSGYYQPNANQTECLMCPAGKFCPYGSITPVDCGLGMCCHPGFLSNTSCHQGEFLHLTYNVSSRPTFIEADALCQDQGYYRLAVIDTSPEYDRMVEWFLNTSVYISGGELTLPAPVWLGAYWTADGLYEWNMCNINRTLVWGAWADGEDPTPASQKCIILDTDNKFKNVDCSQTYDILCEKCNNCTRGFYFNESTSVCDPCKIHTYCPRDGLFEPEGVCYSKFKCNTQATNPHQIPCLPTRYCQHGVERGCPMGTYNEEFKQSTCKTCPAGMTCSNESLQFPNGLCTAGVYCPEGTSNASTEGILCPVGHKCPTGSGSPVPCEVGTYQNETGQGVCKICPEDFYCDEENMTTPIPCPDLMYCQKGSNAATCDDNPYQAGSISVSLSCLPVYSGPIQTLDYYQFNASCSNWTATVIRHTWSIRQCLSLGLSQCHNCRRNIHYIDNNNNEVYLFKPQWTPFNNTGWVYYALVVEVELSNGDAGMAYTTWEYYAPCSELVNCTISPDNGFPHDTMFNVTCGIPDSIYTIWYQLYTLNDLLDQASSPTWFLQLPAASNGFVLPLGMRASINNQTFCASHNFSVLIYPPVDGGYTTWGAWGSCTVTCGTGHQNRTRSCTNPVPQYGGSDCVGSDTDTQNCDTNCPVDGGYTNWSAWGACTVTCGTGHQNRTRSCTNPVPQYGGSDCVGNIKETQDCNSNNCPVDGGYTNWSVWGSCTVTCGTGHQNRTRSCTNPVPQYGGSDCVGNDIDTQDCNTNNCPVDGGYTNWSAWGSCTVTCGTGHQNRTRSCTNPVPQYGGSDCVGNNTETQDCNTNNCPVDGGYTSWGAWGSCTVTCGTGHQNRTRSCTNPAPQYGGSDCVGNDTETQDCNANNCPVDGGYINWSAWGSCTVTCGTGHQNRTRSCTNPVPQYGGSDCVGNDTETQDCNTNNCPVDGGYTSWGAWGSCTVTCGTGHHNRTRSCTSPVPQYGGSDCVGNDTETQDCNTNNCPVDGGYTNWSVWGSCTVTCGTGHQNRTRSCTNPVPQYGGSDCVGNNIETQDCNTNNCPVDGGYTSWGAWGSCTVTCGTGHQNRTRSCTNPVPQYGGSDCVGNDTDTQDCNTNNCPVDGGYTNWSAWGSCTVTCGTGHQNRTRSCTNPVPQYGGSDCVGNNTETQDCNTNNCPVDGGYTSWGAWGSCTVTCGTGHQNRTRSCTNPVPQYGGSDCVGNDTETQDCNTNNCPVNGNYTTWGAWGSCTVTCGTGHQNRTRSCTNPAPQYGGSDCVGNDTETQDCNTNNCPVNGNYTTWGAWGSCTVTCGTGHQNRTRSCTNPAPQYGGGDCVGNDTETQYCNTNNCPVDGGFTTWVAWGSCTVTCGTGQQNRTRSCTNPVPQYGGSDCVGNDTETQYCNTNNCPVDGGYTSWGAWGSCTVTCGTGHQNRTRSCTNPVPQYGGSDCVGSDTDTQDCNTNNCPVDGGYTNWNAWSSCTITCGTGHQNRTRSCTNPVPQYGGSDCVGIDTETQDCNTNNCPVNGGYTNWSVWGSCTAACGSGHQNRTRSCTNPVPQYGGSDCVGNDTETQDCNTNNCPVDGGYTDWGAWGSCSATCGTGYQNRTRTCTNPVPQYGGSDCVGNDTETQDCNTNNCPMDGGYTIWSAWVSCTVTCGTGHQNRTRSCTNPVPQYGGSDCVGNNTVTQDCNTNNCPVDGGYTNWSAWGSCTVTCGTGHQNRTRSCTNPVPQYGGSDCVGNDTETQDCNTNNCPVDGGYTIWSAWVSCTVTCGTGHQNRTRSCTNPVPQYGGSDCVGNNTETQDCNTNNCPVDGGYTIWSAWGSCTVTCGTGHQNRTRSCTNPVPQYGGSDCVGNDTETQDCNTNNCPVDGGYTIWSAWGSCTVTCGTGHQNRTRSCTNPVPQYGGSDCVGNNTETKDCNTNCPVDGGYTTWSAWSSCTVTCGTGHQIRTRSCTNPVPQYGGSDCVGNDTETQDCNTNNCPVDGGYTNWGAWSSCTVTCGIGHQNRTRSCTSPVPQYGGSDCVGNDTDIQDCYTNNCSVDGGYTTWSAWGSCTVTCGTGHQNRTRSCTNPVPQYGGSDCVGNDTETQDCNTNNCPVDGDYTNWSAWGSCTVTCGTGHQNRTRNCTNPVPQYGGSDCVGNDTETQDCNTNNCPMDGGYTNWSAWGLCTVTCGTGHHNRTRSCTNPVPQYGGSDCVGNDTETQACNTNNCQVDGGYTNWSAWGSCTVTCGTGHQNRTRSCTNPVPQYGGSDCVGNDTETQDCNTSNCPVDGGYTTWGAWGSCTVTCGTGHQNRTRNCTNPVPQYGGSDCVGNDTETQDCNTNNCSVDGGYTNWSTWGSCTVTCGTGHQNRTRSCSNPVPQYGGSDCVGNDTETQDCNTNNCSVDGGYTTWGAWGSCTVTCGTGHQNRTRNCTNPVPQYGGSDCVGNDTETQDCNTNNCSVDGGFTSWGAWGSCTATCGTGHQNRTRSCTNPVPQYGGSDCVGNDTETQDCNTNNCSVNGGYTNWGAWGSCTVTCGTGHQNRTRSCTNPVPQYGGSDCVGNDTETQDCSTNNCPVNGSYTTWGAWGSCTVTCGTGHQNRTRSCTNPVPQYGGSNCVGNDTETQDCNTNNCSVDGGYTNWGAWGPCTVTCGAGHQNRTRSCTNPVPQYGGSDCVGNDTEAQGCNTNNCPVNGSYTNWGAWGSCTVTCGTGHQNRTRSCTNPAPQYGGSDCVGNGTETQDCNTNNCSVDGGYTNWGAWGSCTVTCGTGHQNRTRSCTNPVPQYGGSDCVGNDTETQDCNTNNCPVDGGYTTWGAWTSCSVTCGTGQQNRTRSCTNPVPQYGGSDCVGNDTDTQDCNTICPVDGSYTNWGAWGSCTVTCGAGHQNRTRSCTDPAPQYGGSDCVGNDTETQDCNTNNCPVDGSYTTWGAWSSCTVTCGTGHQNRTRSCTNPVPQYGGSDCVGNDTETQDCNTICPVDGGYTNWGAWGSCTVSCGTGHQSRTRSCTNPVPQYGGSDCVGNDTETQDCNTNNCPVNGGYTTWGAWGSCTVTCGTGHQNRTRSCTNPVPQYGGNDCVGSNTDTQDCNTICPVDGVYTNWGAWSPCTASCGTGHQNRTRSCTNPVPQYGGSDCIGSNTDTQNCNTNNCPVDGGYTNWGAWGSCTVTCGTGHQNRTRSCTNPAPQYGGSDCVGNNTETQDCNTVFCPVLDPYEVGTIDLEFSCLPMCTSMMSTASLIKISAVCADCVAEAQTYNWTLRRCDGYSVDSCHHYQYQIHYLDHDDKIYSFYLATLPHNVTGWTHFGMFVKVTLTDGQQGMTYHIWKFFDPAPPPVHCSIDPPTGISLNTNYSTTCEKIVTPEPYNISFSLYKDDSLLVLLYKGPTPNVSHILLPAGFEDGQNNLHLQMVARIQGHRFYMAQIVVQVKPLSLDVILGETSSEDGTDGGEGSSSAIDREIEQGDVFAAIQMLESVTDTLNHALDVVTDNITHTDNSTHADNSTGSSEPEPQQNKLIEFRTQVAKSVAKINISSYHLVSTVSTVLNHVIEKKEQLSEEASEIATDTYSSLAENLVDTLASADEEIPYEEVTNTAGSILKGASSMIDYFTDTMIEESKNNTDDKNGTQYENLDGIFPGWPVPTTSTTQSPYYVDRTVNNTKVVENTQKLLKTVGKVCDALLDRQLEDAEPTIIVTETVKVAVQKLSTSKLSGAKIDLGSRSEDGQATTVTMPDNLGLSNTTKSVRLQTVFMEKNPFVWSATSSEVMTPVVSISLKDSSNNVVNVTELPEPIKLSIPANLDASTPQYLRLKILVKKSSGNNSGSVNYNLGSLRHQSSVATFDFPMDGKMVAGLKFKLPSNLKNIKLHLTQEKAPGLEEIQTEGHSYPEEVNKFLEKFGDYFYEVKNGSIVFFAQNSSVEADEKEVYTTYAGVSVNIDQKDTLQFLADLDPNCVGNQDVEVCDGYIETKVEFRTLTLECLYWKEAEQSWSSQGCWVSTDTGEGRLGCECDHLTAFGGSILVLPASIDPIFGKQQQLQMFDNPVTLTVVMIIWIVYTMLALWARQWDMKDKEKIGIIQCRDNSGKEGTHTYMVCIVTGWWTQAGTTANIFIYIKGSLGESSRICLSTNSKTCFQNGSEDWFLITTNYSLGELRSVTMWHDNSGDSPHWFLNQVYVKDLQRGISWMFIYNDWLAVDRGYTKLITVTIDAITEEELQFRQKYHFFVKTTKDLRDGHIWISIFSKPPSSSFTRVQRLTCCLSILLTTMLTNIMFYGIPTDDPEDQLSAGAFRLSLSQLVIGIQSSLLMFPVNFTIIQLFLRSKPKPLTTPNKELKRIQNCPHQKPHKTKSKSYQSEPVDPQTLYETAFLSMIKFSPNTFPKFGKSNEQNKFHDKFETRSLFEEEEEEDRNDNVFDDGDDDDDDSDDDEYDDDDMEDIKVNNATNGEGDVKEKKDKKRKKSHRLLCCLCQAIGAREKLAPKKAKQIFPWWFIYIAWTVVMLCCLGSSYFVILYGLKFGYVRSTEWLVSFLTGFFHSTFIQEPVKAIAFAMLLTLILRKKVSFDDVQPDLEEDEDEVYEHKVCKKQMTYERHVEPLSSRLLTQIRERLRMEWLLDMTVRDMVVHMMFLVILMVIVHSHRPVTDAYMSSQTIQNLYVNSRNGIRLDEVRTPDDFYGYMHETVLHAMVDVSSRERGDYPSLGCNHYLVGPYRLRQLRVKKDLCPDGTPGCYPAYEFSKEETEHYKPGWLQMSVKAAGTGLWLYNTSWQLKTLPLAGYHATYSGAGYVVKMPKNPYLQQDVLEELEIRGWLDEKTRAVFLEFTLYNPGVDLFSVVVIIFEFTNLGVIFPTHYIFTTSLYHYVDDQEMFLVACELLFIGMNFVFAYLQYKKYKKVGRKDYLKDFWNYVEVIQIILSFSVLVLFIQRYVTVEAVLSDLGTREEEEEEFINIYPAVWSDFVLEYVMACLVSLVILKAIKMLRIHWKPRLVSKTLSHVRSSIFHFMLILTLVMIAYSLGSYLFFQSMLYMYRNVIASFLTNFIIVLGAGDLNEIQMAYGIVGPLFVMIFSVTVTFCLMTVYAAILNVGRMEIVDKERGGRARIRLNDYIKNRLKMFISLK